MIRFGTDGIRGEAGRFPATVEVGVAVGRAAAKLARRSGGAEVVVGRDTRPSGPALAAAVAAGVAAEGLDAVSAGVLPTSGVAVAVAARPGAAGVVVTASHNPAGDNGFKVFGPGGRKLDDAAQTEVEGWLAERPAEGPLGAVRDDGPGCLATATAAMEQAIGPVEALRGRRLAVDLANGAATALRPWLERLPVDLVVVGGGGLINEGCGAVHPEALAAAVRARGCDAGLAVDGDADRCVLVDDRGDVVPGDTLAWWLAKGLGVGTLAVTVMSTTALEASLPGVRVVRTAVGDRALSSALARGADLGCEESGHVLFAGGMPAGDGLVTGLVALSLAWARGAPLAEALAPFRPFPRRLTRVPAPTRPDLDGVPALAEAVAVGEAALGPGGRVFLRYSGTEPVLRVLVEGADEAVVRRVSEQITRLAAEVLA